MKYKYHGLKPGVENWIKEKIKSKEIAITSVNTQEKWQYLNNDAITIFEEVSNIDTQNGVEIINYINNSLKKKNVDINCFQIYFHKIKTKDENKNQLSFKAHVQPKKQENVNIAKKEDDYFQGLGTTLSTTKKRQQQKKDALTIYKGFINLYEDNNLEVINKLIQQVIVDFGINSIQIIFLNKTDILKNMNKLYYQAHILFDWKYKVKNENNNNDENYYGHEQLQNLNSYDYKKPTDLSTATTIKKREEEEEIFKATLTVFYVRIQEFSNKLIFLRESDISKMEIELVKLIKELKNLKEKYDHKEEYKVRINYLGTELKMLMNNLKQEEQEIKKHKEQNLEK